MLCYQSNPQLSMRFRLQHITNEFLSRIWDSIFYSQYTHNKLTDYKKDFLRQEPLNWILLQRKMQEMQQDQINSNTQWVSAHTTLTEQDLQLFQLTSDLKDAAQKMTEEEEGRHIVSPFKPQSFEHEQVQQLISICQSGQLSAEIELELRIEILAVIV